MSFENVEDLYPPTPTQEGLLYHATAEGGDVYHDQITALVEAGDGAELDIDALRAAWRRVAERHAALRTGFLWDGLDEPLQVVRREVEVDVRVVDRPDEPVDRFDQLLAEDRRRGFELDEAPLFRVVLARFADRRWRLLFSFHHLILDGWSARRVLGEVRSLAVGAPDPAAPFPFSRYVAWLGERDRAADEAFWRRRLDGFGAPVRLDLAAAADGTGPGQRELAHLDKGATAALRDVARRHGLTDHGIRLHPPADGSPRKGVDRGCEPLQRGLVVLCYFGNHGIFACRDHV
ncbi:MAG: condensation domain-containing protein, partial [Acidobacteriota bacterium]